MLRAKLIHHWKTIEGRKFCYGGTNGDQNPKKLKKSEKINFNFSFSKGPPI